MTKHAPQIIAKPHPFDSTKIYDTIVAGKSVAQVLEETALKHSINHFYTKRVYVEIDGIPIRPEDYETTFVKDSTNIVIQYCVPHGGDGGSNPLKIIVGIVLTVASFWAGGALGAAYFGANAAVAGSVIGGVLAAASGALLNAMIPAKGLSDKGLGHGSAEESQVYSISGMRNYSPNYKPLPFVLGKFRFAPPYGALPYTHLVGNDQYLHVDVVWGAGELEIADLKIGETKLSVFDNVQVATNRGVEGEGELKLFPNDMYEEKIGAACTHSVPVERTGLQNTDATEIDIVFPRGLTAFNDMGERTTTTVSVTVQYRATGTTAWQGGDSASFSKATAQPLRHTFKVDHAIAGQYDFKIIRNTVDKAPDDNKLYNEFSVATVRSIKKQDPVTFPVPIAETQLVIKATDQLSGMIDTLNGLVESVCLDYDSVKGNWVKRATSNPASLFRHLLQSVGNAKPVPDRRIDITALEEWHTFCETEGFEYGAVYDSQSSTRDRLVEICRAGRATLTEPNGVYSVVIDKPRVLLPVQSFTPENSVNFSMSKSFVQDIHAYRVNFNNRASDYAEDEIVVYAEGFNKDNATLIEATELPGVTDATAAAKLTKYLLASRIFRSETYSFETDWEHVVAERGELCTLANPSILVSQITGQIKNVNLADKTILLDQEPVLKSGKEYGINLRCSPTVTEGATVVSFKVTQDATDPFLLHYTSEISATPVKGDLYSFGEYGLEKIFVLITSKRHSSNLRAKLTAIQYSWDEIEAFLGGAYPPVNPVISPPVPLPLKRPPTPSFGAITGGKEAVKKLAGGKVIGRIIASIIVPPSNVAVTEVDCECREEGENWVRSTNLDPADAFEFENIEDGTVELRCRTASGQGQYSAWFYMSYEQDLIYDAPLAPTELTVTGGTFCNELAWELPLSFVSGSRVEIWCSPSVNNRNVAEIVGVVGQGKAWTHTNLDPLTPYYYWLRIKTAENLYSEYSSTVFAGVGGNPNTNADTLLKQLKGQRIDEDLGIDGNLVVARTITSSKMAANEVFAMSLESQNYVPGETGYLLDSINGVAEFNDIELKLNYLSQGDLDAGFDTTDGGIKVRNATTGSYAHLHGGDIVFYYNINGTLVPYKNVKRYTSGTVENGATVQLDGYFKERPHVMVSAATSCSYKASRSGGDQYLEHTAENIVEYPADSKRWRFTAASRLIAGAQTFALSIPNVSVGCSYHGQSSLSKMSPAATTANGTNRVTLTGAVTCSAVTDKTRVNIRYLCDIFIDGAFVATVVNTIRNMGRVGQGGAPFSVPFSSAHNLTGGVHSVAIRLRVLLPYGGSCFSASGPGHVRPSMSGSANITATQASETTIETGTLNYIAIGE